MPFLHLKEHHIFLKFSLLFTVYFCGVGCSAWEVFWVLCLLFFFLWILSGWVPLHTVTFYFREGPSVWASDLSTPLSKNHVLARDLALTVRTDRQTRVWRLEGSRAPTCSCCLAAPSALMWLWEGLLFSASLEIFMLGEFSQTLQCEFSFWCISKCGVGGWAL